MSKDVLFKVKLQLKCSMLKYKSQSRELSPVNPVKLLLHDSCPVKMQLSCSNWSMVRQDPNVSFV